MPLDRRLNLPTVVAACGLLAVALAVHELSRQGFSVALDDVLYQALIFASGAVLLARGAQHRRLRGWAVLGAAVMVWGVGDIVFEAERSLPVPSIADVLELAFYPLAFAGIVTLVRRNISGFDSGRWIDGLAVALVIAIPAVSLTVQPVAEHAHHGLLANATDIAYPVLDLILFGCATGVLALTGWKPGRSWLVLAAAMIIWSTVDAVYAVQSVEGSYVTGRYDFLWPVGAIVLAGASLLEPQAVVCRPIHGFKAIALPVFGQVVALATQLYGLRYDIPLTERALTMPLLGLIILQLVLARPRHPRSQTESPPPEG